MNNEVVRFLDKYRILVVLVVLGVFIGIVGLTTMNQPVKRDSVTQATMNLEKAQIESVKASLNVYYADKGEYPFSYEELIDYTQTGKDILIKAEKDIRDFKYTHRGDYQAYKITYTDIDGNKKTVQGNYQDDYHE